MYAFKKQTDRAECGLVFIVDAPGTGGGIYSNAHDLRKYIKRKAKEGFKLETVKKMDVACYQPHYLIRICKDPRDFGMEYYEYIQSQKEE